MFIYFGENEQRFQLFEPFFWSNFTKPIFFMSPSSSTFSCKCRSVSLYSSVTRVLQRLLFMRRYSFFVCFFLFCFVHLSSWNETQLYSILDLLERLPNYYCWVVDHFWVFFFCFLLNFKIDFRRMNIAFETQAQNDSSRNWQSFICK